MLMGITCICVIMTVVILRLYHKPETEPLGPKTKTAIQFLGRITFMKVSSASNVVTPALQEDKFIKRLQQNDSVKEIGENKRKPSNSSDEIPMEPPKQVMTWQEVSQLLDWFLFLFTSFLSLIVTVVFMFQLLVQSKGQPSLGVEDIFSTDLWRNGTAF
ncbi:hypothetical protein PoB_001809600 [Plakobranchus ocellatus]|uniref:Neurotransmitter-gated ion-channel transmembrane domain-containing protein n=1 Tax=Plakobranchus ocellatus TaxID=259542 RepID=A0AAV3Z6R4_9GAST|nr:hypothetical protein PoB_001809600 [Plakobranchus ocellatus]